MLKQLILYIFYPAFMLVFSAINIHAGDLIASQDLEDLEDILDTKISTASKYEQTMWEAPASISIISSEDIERYAFTDLAEILNSVKGLSIRNDRSYKYLGIRGNDDPSDYGNKILILVNGHVCNDNYYGGALWGNGFGIDVKMIERVEILKGPGSSMYGTGAMYGVVNVILKEGKDINGIKVGADIGSFGRKRASLLAGKAFDNGFDFSVTCNYGDITGEDLYFKEYDSPETNNGLYENNDYEKFLNFTSNISYADFSLLAYYSKRDKGVPTSTYSSVFNDPSTEYIDSRRYLELKYKNDINEMLNLKARVYYDYYGYDGSFPYDDDGYYIWEDYNRSNWAGAEIQTVWDFIPSNRLTLGIEYKYNFQNRYKSWSEDVIYYNEDYTFSNISMYIQDDYQLLENLALSLGFRYDQYFEAIEESAITPRLAVVYNISEKDNLKFIYNEAFRAQNIYEIYYEAENEAIGNLGLKPEKIHARELMYEREISSELIYTISAFHFNMSNLITPKFVTSSYFGEEMDLLQFQNLNKTKSSGIETGFNARFKNGLWAYVNYSFQEVKNKDTDKRMPNAPFHIVKCGLSYKISNMIFISADCSYESERYTLENDEYSSKKTDPFFVANTVLVFKPHKNMGDGFYSLLNHLEMSLRINNVLDNEYYLPVSFDFLPLQSVPQVGRNIIFNVAYKF